MPILDPRTFEFISRSPEQTRRLGARLGAALQKGDLLCLIGDLGSGKTTMVQGIAHGWGTLDSVSSPTFVLVNHYRRPDGSALFHMDAYRLNGALDAEDLDLTNMLESGALLVEWAERITPVLPKERLTVDLRWLADEQRGMVITARGARYEAILNEFRQKVFGG